MTKKTLRHRAAVAAVAIAASAAAPLVLAPTASAASGFGAIAYAPNGASGWAVRYGNRGAAEQTARNYCGYTDCKVLTSFVGGCGAVAYNGFTYQGGGGATLAEAQNDAMGRLGGGWIDSWACN
ncbi:DUF4189 domain-containing protein [Mycolicibacterium brumae]|uniref:DUF4189 domain-containing protein n=1 Tax=Mycolicibacterium brumae TaxID=85968 RepID=A0A2G5P878_9MYCO|nr:DUF4189 domain-containing protein [Mycolicibacterium brumae]MCV7194789.1 DUF4189 domain-containing protein [Mycolicibacterium brumae]PIB74552.1 DUF4189 domain-containing protein [Mycolicibacterium brumae]RWA19791.1 hypothetical protein MBRU_16520 [Mycolicibacterium brumae DSM 44177]UWW09568.1 DUF4189 domain-containing protein [Mycolicibacterium brumae]